MCIEVRPVNLLLIVLLSDYNSSSTNSRVLSSVIYYPLISLSISETFEVVNSYTFLTLLATFFEFLTIVPCISSRFSVKIVPCASISSLQNYITSAIESFWRFSFYANYYWVRLRSPCTEIILSMFVSNLTIRIEMASTTGAGMLNHSFGFSASVPVFILNKVISTISFAGFVTITIKH